MKKLLILFLVSLVQGAFAMSFSITAEIKKNMRKLHPPTFSVRHSRPTIQNCHAQGRIFMAKMDICARKYRYVRFETDEQIDQLADQIAGVGEFRAGRVSKIEWFYYDSVQESAPISTDIMGASMSDDDYSEDARE